MRQICLISQTTRALVRKMRPGRWNRRPARVANRSPSGKTLSLRKLGGFDSAIPDERVEVGSVEADEFPDLVVAQPVLEDELAYEALACS